LRPTAHKGEVRRFRPGLDYTVGLVQLFHPVDPVA
jgi:hypothetical protein